jgi:hypothetical protein
MPDEVEIAQSVSIRECGFDEYWLQDQIFENPASLGLGELEAISRERRQSSGGRLDILLKDPSDDSMYEVEVMLGETDETHIIRTIEYWIRTIEYWDNEKRKWPQRQHFAVLVAEHINRRFFNVIHLLSHAIPIIAIQASMLLVNKYFTTILDTYEEVEDEGPSARRGEYTREYWEQRAAWTLDATDTLLTITREIFNEPTLNYAKYYVAITVNRHNYMWLHKRSQSKSLLHFRMAQPLQDETVALLNAQNITYVRRPNTFRMTVDRPMIEREKDLFTAVAKLVKRSWEAGAA